MTRRPVDLSAHINQTVTRGHPADFPVTLRPVCYRNGETYHDVPKRLAVVREDSGRPLAVVSDRYTLVPHQRIVDLVEEAIAPLDVGPVPRGIFVDRMGARMRAVLKFPALARAVIGNDEICPCLEIENSYDTRSRIALHIGAFRFVCTNLAVGGGGVFAGGFVSVHAGEIPIETVADQLANYLRGFERIVELYRQWVMERLDPEAVSRILEPFPATHRGAIEKRIESTNARSVYDAYNVATDYATHEMRSFRTAFALLERVNRGFQEQFPAQASASDRELPDSAAAASA